MTPPRILGLDPGFANLGWAVVELHGDSERVVSLGVLHTEKTKRKGVSVAEDNVRRAREIATLLRSLALLNAPMAIAAEAMSYPPNASAAGKMSLAWGVVAAIAEAFLLPVLQVTPQKLKEAVAYTRAASKDEVEAHLIHRYGRPLEDLAVPIKRADREHAFDALGAIVALRDDPAIRAARAA